MAVMDMKPTIYQAEAEVVAVRLVTEFMVVVMAGKAVSTVAAVAKDHLPAVGKDQAVLVDKAQSESVGNIIFYGTFCINRPK
jgi:hypothetical protein